MIYELAKQDERIVFIGSDLGAGVLDEFKRDMPDRFFMEGVAEQNLVGMAAGLALSGKIVYVNTIATFLTRRAFEQVCIDVGLHKANVRLIGNGGGAVYAPLGPTHIATDDIALMRQIPGMTILSPCDAVEMEELMPQTVEHAGPIYIRLGKGGDPILPKNEPTKIGMAMVNRRRVQSYVSLISTGTTSQLALAALHELEKDGILGVMAHLPTIKPFPYIGREGIELCHLITIEDHSVIGGLGAAMAEWLGASPVKSFTRIGYPDCFPSGYGTQDEMRARYGISVENIVRTVKELCGQPR